MIFLKLFLAYLILVLLIGISISKRVKKFEDFMVAGRRLSFPLTTFSLMATWTGAAAITGYTGWIYGAGFSMIWIAFCTTSALLFVGLVFARRLSGLALYTIPELLLKRYGKGTQRIGALTITLYCTGMVSAQLLGGAAILSVVLGWSYESSILLSSLVIITYTALGGLWAVALTDFFQFFVLGTGLILAIPLTLYKVGGLSQMLSSLPTEHLDPLTYAPPLQILSWFLIIFPSILIDPAIYQRIYASKTPRIARLSLGFTGIWDFFLTLITLILGLSAFSLYAGEEVDLALPTVIKTVFPEFLGAFILVAILAAVMSTADSFLLVGAGTLTKDLLNREGMLKVRVITVVLGFLAILIALYFSEIMYAVLFSSAVYVAALFIPIMGVFLKFGGPKGAFLSAIAGGGTAILWRILNLSPDPIIAGILTSAIIFLGVSRFEG
ncbi:MAG: sodium:solute symporter [Candidatus Methanofastidiosia archaeon]